MQKKDLIKRLLQEAEVYHSQGLLSEAKAKFREAADSIRITGKAIQKQVDILQVIQSKIDTIEKEITRIDNAPVYQRVAPQAQELIKTAFSFSRDADLSALEGAVALARFGQIDEAVKEFRGLIAYDHLRLAAAKNIIRCLVVSASPELAVSEFGEWLSSGSFPSDQLEKIRSFLESILKRKNALISIPEVLPTAVTIETEAMEEEVYLDITSIEFALREGSKIELEVGFQNGCILHLIVPEKDQERIGYLTECERIEDMRFYSPVAIFSGAAVVVAKSPIEEGPKKGCLAVDLKVLNA